MTDKKQAEAERYLKRLSTAELLELQVMIDEELARREEEDAQQEPAVESSSSAKSAKSGRGSGGYIELKEINGCGPYAYRRARVNGRMTSTYLGKVNQ